MKSLQITVNSRQYIKNDAAFKNKLIELEFRERIKNYSNAIKQ